MNNKMILKNERTEDKGGSGGGDDVCVFLGDTNDWRQGGLISVVLFVADCGDKWEVKG